MADATITTVMPFTREELDAATITMNKRINYWLERTKANGIPMTRNEATLTTLCDVQCELTRLENVVLRLTDKIKAQRKAKGVE